MNDIVCAATRFSCSCLPASLSIFALGAMCTYLKRCLIDQALLSMGLFAAYCPADLGEGGEDWPLFLVLFLFLSQFLYLY